MGGHRERVAGLAQSNRKRGQVKVERSWVEAERVEEGGVPSTLLPMVRDNDMDFSAGR